MKWRIVKKKFNREKQKAIGHLVCATFKDGSQVWSKIKDIKISPAGGNKAKYDLKTEPCDPPELPKPTGKTKDGISMSFDLKMNEETKRNIRKLVDQF
ncbi:MAG: hypothetical protein IJJ56_11955 [Prevotella sp.]|nr:hypothetical protein [Prevotella sp.]